VDNFYCSQKFWYLTVIPEKRVIASCCAATPQKINLSWLEKNPGKLFNTPELIKEREMMLNNLPVPSCEDNCWRAERQGKISRRIAKQSQIRTLTDLESTPRILNIVLPSNCNLTCSYCCKQYSSAWLHDINANGPYLENDSRFIINADDLITLKLGQVQIKNSNSYNAIIDECQNYKNLEGTSITGGEPFLFNGLVDLISKLSGPVEISTGLGINTNRLSKIIDQLPSDIRITVSAENVGSLYEFNRYGNSWDQFQRNLDLITKKFKQYRFVSVISNTTIHGYEEFQRQYYTDGNEIMFCNDPDYLAVNVIDEYSKTKYNLEAIGTEIQNSYSAEQKQKFQRYINEFAARRNLSLDVFPEHFKNWILT